MRKNGLSIFDSPMENRVNPLNMMSSDMFCKKPVSVYNDVWCH